MLWIRIRIRPYFTVNIFGRKKRTADSVLVSLAVTLVLPIFSPILTELSTCPHKAFASQIFAHFSNGVTSSLMFPEFFFAFMVSRHCPLRLYFHFVLSCFSNFCALVFFEPLSRPVLWSRSRLEPPFLAGA